MRRVTVRTPGSSFLGAAFHGGSRLCSRITPERDSYKVAVTLPRDGQASRQVVAKVRLRASATVVWRKPPSGTPGAAASRFVEAILTVVETCHQQSWNSLESLTAAIQAHFAAQTSPLLLPGV